ncbi:MAG: 2-hydroxyacid dehydrogenase [Bdellovibrionales bacterium]|nr:2-hydroxyacid dehydrogenase [Bdellovibrionales bacterium]
MRIAFFSTKPYDKEFFRAANSSFGYEISFIEAHLTPETVGLAADALVICAFVNDKLDGEVLRGLSALGVKAVALRSAGFNHVDLRVAQELGMKVMRVPSYSPHAVAEHTLALLLSLNRKIPRAYNRVREGNFSLDGLLGFDLYKKTVGIVGTGNIGRVVCEILLGFGCRVLAHDPKPSESCRALGVEYVAWDELLKSSDIISLHCPLTSATRHMIDESAIGKMKQGVLVLNTGRGALIDTKAVIQALKRKKIGGLGLDVYEEEAELFFDDLSNNIIQDDVFMRLLTFPNVLITGHQAFFTREALAEIAHTTLSNVAEFVRGVKLTNEVSTF